MKIMRLVGLATELVGFQYQPVKTNAAKTAAASNERRLSPLSIPVISPNGVQQQLDK